MKKKKQKEQGQEREIQRGTVDVGLLDDGLIVIQFGTPITQMTFSPEQARAFGVGLIETATKGFSLQRVQPPGLTGHASKARH